MGKIPIKRPADIEKMRTAGKIVAAVLAELEREVKPGMTTADLDEIAADMIEASGGRPSFLHYQVEDRIYPANICTSVNDEVVHGIPGYRVLSEGDIVGVDVGVFLNGFHADSAATIPVGAISPEAVRLLEITRQALAAGIAAVKAGRRIGQIGSAVQRFAESRGYHVVRQLVGHGVGRELHEAPPVPNFGKPNEGERLETGMTLAIEPMINIGTGEVMALADHWTIVTADGSLSAHFEHTVAVTRNGPDILTCL